MKQEKLKDMKLCCDCQHSHYNETSGYIRCDEEKLSPPNYIFGSALKFCEDVRPACGEENPKYFKRKTGTFNNGAKWQSIQQKCSPISKEVKV